MKPESKTRRSIGKSIVGDTELCKDFSKLVVSNGFLATNNNETALHYDFSKLSEALDGVRSTGDSCYDFTEIKDALHDVNQNSKSSVRLRAQHGVGFKSQPQPHLPLMYVQYPKLEKWDDMVNKKREQNRRNSMYPICLRLSTIVEIGASRGKSLRSSK